MTWTLDPAPGAADISPLGPVSLAVDHGTLQSVTVTNADGKQLAGAIAADGRSFGITEELGYGRTYVVAASAVDPAGLVSAQAYQFSTLTPGNKTLATAFPTDGMTVGVGQPIAIYFDEPIADKAAVQKMITVTTSTPVEGAFYWLSDKEVHWRPRNFWPPNIHVDVAVLIYGKDVGNGIFGQEDKRFAFDIGQSKVAFIDDNTHHMIVQFDNVQVADIPVSLGRNKYPTYNGIHVVAEKYESKIMDSSTWGLTGTGAYRTEVFWATRISSSGEFVHAAPWSVGSQGYENVSHGCVNVSTDWAKWFYDNFTYGDVVMISNTVGPQLQVWDGYGDWTLSWDEYAKGGAI